MTEPTEINQEEAPAEPAGEPVDEFAGLSPAPPRRSPILALSIIGLSFFTIFHLRNDIRYALSPHQPTESTATVGRYVSVHGIAGRHDSLFVESRGDKGKETLFRLLDVDPPLFVRAMDTADRVELPGTWKGRLQRFQDLSWASSMREYFAKTPQKLTRALDLASLKARVANPGAPLVDRRGRALTLADGAEVEVAYEPSEYALYLARDKFPKKEDAQHELERILAKRPSTPKPTVGEDTPDSFVFYLPLEKDSAQQNAFMALFQRTADDTSPPVDIELHARTMRAPLSALQHVEWDKVSEVRIDEALHISDDTLVLCEGETPQGFLWAPLTAFLLLALAAWNVWYLARPRRA